MYELLPSILEGNDVRRPNHYEAPQFYSLYVLMKIKEEDPGFFVWEMDFLQQSDAGKYIMEEVTHIPSSLKTLFSSLFLVENKSLFHESLFLLTEFKPWLRYWEGGKCHFDIPDQFIHIEEALVARFEKSPQTSDATSTDGHSDIDQTRSFKLLLDFFEAKIRACYPAHILEDIAVKPR